MVCGGDREKGHVLLEEKWDYVVRELGSICAMTAGSLLTMDTPRTSTTSNPIHAGRRFPISYCGYSCLSHSRSTVSTPLPLSTCWLSLAGLAVSNPQFLSESRDGSSPFAFYYRSPFSPTGGSWLIVQCVPVALLGVIWILWRCAFRVSASSPQAAEDGSAFSSLRN